MAASVPFAVNVSATLATIRPNEPSELREARIQHHLQTWYRVRALERLQEETSRYAREIGVAPAGVYVRHFRARWGSCDKRGLVVFPQHRGLRGDP